MQATNWNKVILISPCQRCGSKRSLFGLVTQPALSLTRNAVRGVTRPKKKLRGDNSRRDTDAFYFCSWVFKQ